MPAPLGRSLAQRHTTVLGLPADALKFLSAELCIPYLYPVQLIIPSNSLLTAQRFAFRSPSLILARSL